MTSEWNEFKKSILLTKKDETIIIKIGDCIIHNLRELPIRVEEFTYDKDNILIGLVYLPWRGTKWGTPLISLRGNPRHIICIPTGIMHYGQHIEWESVSIVPNPEK